MLGEVVLPAGQLRQRVQAKRRRRLVVEAFAVCVAATMVPLFEPVGIYRPRMLMLRDDRVVAGQDALVDRAHPPVTFNDPVGPRVVSPSQPYPVVVSPSSSAPCQGFDWQRLWAGQGQYTLVVVMKAYPSQMATQRRWSAPHGAWESDQYLVARQSFIRQ